MHRRTLTTALALLLSAALFAAAPARAAGTEQQALVDKAELTLESFSRDPNMGAMRDYLKRARGVFIVPQLLRAGFIIGGSGGSGVLLARDQTTDAWSEPAFFSMGAGSIGFQIGADASEVVLLVMTEKGVDAILANNLRLGAGASIAAGPVGGGVGGGTTANLGADLVSFNRAQGLYGGISVEGAVIAYRDGWNRDYYGSNVSPTDIVVRRKVANAGADGLRRTLTELAAK